jgi:hypothetical protein
MTRASVEEKEKQKALTPVQRNILLLVIGITLASMATYNLLKSKQ